MTTMAEARGALASALETGGVPYAASPGAIDVPCHLIFGDGLGDIHPIRGQVEARFRVALLAGGWLEEVSASRLDALKLAAMTVARELQGWRFIELRADYLAPIAGGQYLAADMVASTFIDI